MIRVRKRKGLQLPCKKGARTFKSEEAAKAYAESKGIKKYSLKNLRLDPKVIPKIKIIPEI